MGTKIVNKILANLIKDDKKYATLLVNGVYLKNLGLF